MFKREFRLSKKTEFTKSFQTPLFSLRIAKNTFDYSRFGFIVSKRIDKRATFRNRIKRVFRSCIEENFDKITKGHDMLFVLKKEVASVKRDQLCAFLMAELKNKGFIQ